MKSKIDLATIGGLIIAFAMITAAIMIGGKITNFYDLPSVLLVVVGTLAITAICFSTSEVAMAPHIIVHTILTAAGDPKFIATEILRFAELARQKGILALENEINKIRKDKMFYKCMRLVVDGIPANDVERIMRNELGAIKSRHVKSANILKKAAEFAPAMGLIGTLIGLIQMLANLDDPSTIGPAMGLALITTFYGAVMANMIFLPLAAKLEHNAREEEMINLLYLMGAISIARQENPRRLEMMLNTVLPPSKRVKVYD